MKKGWIKFIVLIIGFLGGCYLIGQVQSNENLSSETEQEFSQEQQKDEITITPIQDDVVENNNIENNSNQEETKSIELEEIIEFEGNVVTEDNPWNTTAGYITIEDKKYIFLTPNTSVYLNDVNCNENLMLSCGIYDAMREYSDGAGLIIWVLDEQDNIIYEEELLISNEEELINYTLLLSQFENIKRIKFLCNNGIKDDDSGDWVLLNLLN